jgi:DNA-binding protein HU-beta
MPQARRAKQAGSAALDRLRASIEAAEGALKDLQGEVSRDSRELLKDVGKTLRTAQRNLTRGRGRIVKDIEQIQQALVKGRTARPGATATSNKGASSKRTAAKRAPAKRATAKRTTAKRTTAKGAPKRAAAKRTAAKPAAAKRPASKRSAAKPAKRTAGATRRGA